MKLVMVLFTALSLFGCAEVPRQSVDLSNALGNDLIESRRAHLRLADLYFDKMEADTNRFVDQVYAPYQINKTLEKFQKTLVGAITKGADSNSSAEDRSKSLAFLEVYLTEVRNNIEQFREESLAPIRAQRKTIAQQVSDSYTNMSQANAAVTAYLASLVKIKDAQNEVLAKLGAPGLQDQVAAKLSKASEEIEKLNKQATSSKADVEKVISQFQAVMRSTAKP
jgi:hypothetical protein